MGLIRDAEEKYTEFKLSVDGAVCWPAENQIRRRTQSCRQLINLDENELLASTSVHLYLYFCEKAARRLVGPESPWIKPILSMTIKIITASSLPGTVRN
jgi:hypothetical protein